MSVCERFRQIRTKEGLTTRNMSLLMGASESLWTQYETGRKEPSLATLARLRQRGYSIDWLLTGQGPMTFPPEAGDNGQSVPEPATSVSALLRELEALLMAHRSNSLLIWSALAAELDSRADGATLEQLTTRFANAIAPERLKLELDKLQADGIVAQSRGYYRWIRASLDFHSADAELQVLLAIQELLNKHLPKATTLPRKWKVVRDEIWVEKGEGLNRVRELGRRFDSWLRMTPVRPAHAGGDMIRVIMSVVLTQGSET